MNPLDQYRRRTDELLALRTQAVAAMGREEKALESAKGREGSVLDAQRIVQGIAQTLQQRAHTQIASVVSRCLEAVFDDAYEFRILFERKRGKTEARLVFVRDGLTLEDPLNEAGGGAVDVAALALRVACLLLSRPSRRRLLVLDEPLKNVRGLENRRRVRGLLLKLAEEMGIQFVLNVDVEAYPEFRMGKVVELRKEGT